MSSAAGRPRFLFSYRFCGLGGVETSILNKAKALRQAGADVQVLFAEFYGAGGDSIAQLPWVTVGLAKPAIRDLLQQGFDAIVVIDYPPFLDFLDGRVASRVFFETHSALPGTRAHFYSRLSFPRLAGLVVPSRFNQRLIQAAGGATAPIFVVPNPIDPDVFHQRAAATLPAEFQPWLDAPVVLWVGRFEDEKNPAEFLRVAAHVSRSHPRARFLMVGDTPAYDTYRAKLDELVEERVRPQLTFLRGVPNDQMPALYSLAAHSGGCLLSTSLHEAQPMIFLEAMACGCPVVASRVDGVPDLISDGENGRLYDLGQVHQAANAIGELMDPAKNPARAILISRAGAMIERDHAPAVVAQRYLDLLDRVPSPAPFVERRPLVSGILIFLNGENFIDEAIQSVLAQRYENWELLLVDDGSTDRSTTIARDYAARYPGKIRYIEHEGHRNRGKSESRNFGLHHAKGEYVALLDHDDIWLPNKLEDQVRILEARPEVALMYGRTRYWHSWTGKPSDQDRDGLTQLGVEPDTTIPPPELITLLLRDERTVASPCSLLIRRDAALQVGGFPESFHSTTYDDVAFLSQLYLEYPVFVADDCWDYYRQHRDNATATARRIGQWHPRRPNPRREMLVNWIEEYVLRKGTANTELLAALDTAVAPYRRPPARSDSQRIYDACLDGTLAVLRGDDFAPIVARLADIQPSSIDPQAVAEHIFDAVPESTWNAESLWLEIWPDAKPQITTLLEAIESRIRSAGLAHRARAILEQLIQGTWLLRAAEGNAAALKFDGDDPERVRVEIGRATSPAVWDIQLNRPRLIAVARQRYIISFQARADAPRAMSFGFARAHAPWDNLGLYQTLELRPDWQHVEIDFVATDAEQNARIHFDLGASGISIDISQVRLRQVSQQD